MQTKVLYSWIVFELISGRPIIKSSPISHLISVFSLNRLNEIYEIWLGIIKQICSKNDFLDMFCWGAFNAGNFYIFINASFFLQWMEPRQYWRRLDKWHLFRGLHGFCDNSCKYYRLDRCKKNIHLRSFDYML